MSALATRPRPKLAKDESPLLSERNVTPIVAALDGSAASRAAIGEAIRLAGELSPPIVSTSAGDLPVSSARRSTSGG